MSAARRAARAGGQGPSAVASRVVRFESRADGDLSSTHPSPPPPWSERVAPRTDAAAPAAAVRHGGRPRPRPRPRRRERERRHVPPDRPRPTAVGVTRGRFGRRFGGSTRGVSRFHLESAVPSWSQRFWVGVSVESAPSDWSQVLWVGVSVESARSHWSQLLQLESAWSQVFWVGVSVESALSHWSQPLQLESAWSQQLRSLHAGASWSGMESAAPARSGSLRLAPQRSERSCVGAGVGVLVICGPS